MEFLQIIFWSRSKSFWDCLLTSCGDSTSSNFFEKSFFLGLQRFCFSVTYIANMLKFQDQLVKWIFIHYCDRKQPIVNFDLFQKFCLFHLVFHFVCSIAKSFEEESTVPSNYPHRKDLWKNAKSKFAGLAELSIGNIYDKQTRASLHLCHNQIPHPHTVRKECKHKFCTSKIKLHTYKS